MSPRGIGSRTSFAPGGSVEIENESAIAWQSDPELRLEFAAVGGFDAYLAYRRAVAAGQVRILKAR